MYQLYHIGTDTKRAFQPLRNQLFLGACLTTWPTTTYGTFVGSDFRQFRPRMTRIRNLDRISSFGGVVGPKPAFWEIADQSRQTPSMETGSSLSAPARRYTRHLSANQASM